ncbi:hypothetical protein [Caldalkalibacillus mannanilyticus]|uniref:hypothetical protein n=1 Tax=Caldalkalibacillus mannanilyticus TaxID=1418 RepID=UPI00046ACA15|nr:hypothetical protein [Caldalkalibacillus mannanilyticus]
MFYTEKVEEVNEWFSTWVSRIPQEQKSQVIDLLDNVMFYLSNFFQQRERTLELERKIILEARLFDSTIDQLEDMEKLSLHQLEYLEEKWKTKYTMYSMIEGGLQE